MVNVESYINEFISEEDINEKELATILGEPSFPEKQTFKNLVADVSYKGENRKLSINKSNAERLAKVWTYETKKWISKKVRIRIPSPEDNARSGTKFVLDPISEELQKEERIRKLREKGISEESLKALKDAGEL